MGGPTRVMRTACKLFWPAPSCFTQKFLRLERERATRGAFFFFFFFLQPASSKASRRRRRRRRHPKTKKKTQREDKKKEKKKSHTISFLSLHHFSDAHFDRRTRTLNNKLTRVFLNLHNSVTHIKLRCRLHTESPRSSRPRRRGRFRRNPLSSRCLLRANPSAFAPLSPNRSRPRKTKPRTMIFRTCWVTI